MKSKKTAVLAISFILLFTLIMSSCSVINKSDLICVAENGISNYDIFLCNKT